ncbi:MAG: NAD(P)H-binding protein, partial [Exiguobacterium sp.]
MKMKVVILGAAGAISRMVTERLLEETDAELVLYARRANARLSIENERVTKIDGHFGEKDKLIQAFTD